MTRKKLLSFFDTPKQTGMILSVPLEPIVRLCLLSCVSFVFFSHILAIDQYRNHKILFFSFVLLINSVFLFPN